MAKDYQNRAAKDRRPDVEALAADIFCRRVVSASGMTPESLAREALDAARAFYRVCDETSS